MLLAGWRANGRRLAAAGALGGAVGAAIYTASPVVESDAKPVKRTESSD